MTQQPATEKEKSFFRNDRKLVCSMLVVYGFCILGLIAVAFWGLSRRQLTLSANATSTALAAATQQANGTATAVVHRKELETYEFIDHFDTNVNKWMLGSQDNEYWIGKTIIKAGVYLWDVAEVKQGFIQWANCSEDKTFEDFDIYVDSKILESKSNQVCSGLIFRRSSKGWDHGGYAFNVCNSAFFNVAYHGEDGWQQISDWQYHPAIQATDWNRLEVNARGDQFTFTINNIVVFEITDNRQKDGEIALFVELHDENPAKILFDNFGYQRR
jgi:hypothetical protein